MSEPRLVSVITPVYNGSPFIAECIESVLSQSYNRFEYVICDNHSTDGTAAIVAGYERRDGRIRVVRPARFLPQVANWNFSVDQSSRESAYIMREPREYYGGEPYLNPFGYGNGYYQQRPGHYYYDRNSGRYVPAPRDPYRYPGQYGQQGQPGRDPRVQSAPRDPYGREYPTQRVDPFFFPWGNRRSY